MLLPMPRCDHCDAVLNIEHVERDRKRFCCADCRNAFDRGELKAISPHDHTWSGAVIGVHGASHVGVPLPAAEMFRPGSWQVRP